MTEDFLHFLWQFQYFDKQNLATTQRQSLHIWNTGQKNTNAGADFDFAKISLNDIEWVGSVEIHIRSSDWNHHKHQLDTNYNNVILHVVWQDDHPIQRQDATFIPTLELKDKVNEQWLYQYEKLLENKKPIPCASQLNQVSDLHKIMMLDKALSKRLEKKAGIIYQLWIDNQNDWEETTYQLVAKNFGFKINSEAFLRLSQTISLKTLRKHTDNLLQIEALLFGQAGFLEDSNQESDEYIQKLQKEYHFLDKKYQLRSTQLEKKNWKFLRLRPANFPTVRLAQFASLIHQKPHLFSFLLDAEAKELFQKFQIKQSLYWQSHYTIGKETKGQVPGLGKTSLENIIINTIAPLRACYAKAKAEQKYMDSAIRLLENTKAESNKITRMWSDLGWKTKSAFDSQALIELYEDFCTLNRCLSCTIGIHLIRK